MRPKQAEKIPRRRVPQSAGIQAPDRQRETQPTIQAPDRQRPALSPRPAPVPALQRHGFHEDLDTFRDRLRQFTETHEAQNGYKPPPGLAFDVARSKVPPEQFSDLLLAPTSKRLAGAKKAATTFLPPTELQGQVQQVVKQMPLTDEELESHLVDEYLEAVRDGKEDEFLRGESGPEIVRLLETKPALKSRAHRAQVEQDRERVQAGLGDFPAVATGAFIRGSLQVVGGLAAGPPVLAYEEGKGVKKSVEQKSLKPLAETQKHLAVGAAQGIWEDVTHPQENFGFLLLDLFGAGSLARGAGRRANVARKGGNPIKKPLGGQIEYRKGGYSAYERGSDNLLANDLQRLKARWVNRRMEKRHAGEEPSGLLSVIRPRWAADHIDTMLDKTLREHLSGERKLGRLAMSRRRIERALDEVGIAELQHVDKATPVQQRINRVRRIVPGLTVGEQKALQVRFSDLEGDDISKLRQWKEFHEHVIENAPEVAERLGFSRDYAPVIQENHRAQLQALALAEKVFKKKPSKRLTRAEELTRELEAEATALKIEEMGLAPEVASGRIAAVGDVVRGKKSLARDKQVSGTYLHGRGDKGAATDPNRPLFLTTDREAAEFYARERGDLMTKGEVMEVPVDLKRPANWKDLEDARAAVGATEKDINAHSPYDGDNPTDYLYVPKVVAELRRRGFDGYAGWDAFTNREVPIAVPFRQGKAERVSPDSIYTKFESRRQSKKATKLEQRLIAGPRVGEYWMPPQDLKRLMPELYHAFTGKSIEMGDFRIDTTRLVAESTGKALRNGAKVREWKLLLTAAKDKPTGSGFDIPIADGTAKNIPQELKEMLAQVNEGHIDADHAEFLTKQEDRSLIEHLFPGTDPETGKLIGKGPIAGVKWVDRRLVMGMNVLPKIPDTAARKAGQVANEPLRAATLFARPAYGLNIPSNAGMLILQQGAWTGNNLVRSLFSHRIYGDRLVRQMDAAMGEGPNLSMVNLDIHMKSLIVGQSLARLWNKLADQWMRRAAFIHEMHRQGFKGKKGAQEFLNNPEHASKVVEAGIRGQDHMIKFNNLTEFEKQNLRNIFFIYPFRTRGIVWSLHTIKEHPAQSAILAAIGAEGAEDLREEIEKRVPDQLQKSVIDWFDKTGFMPISWDDEGNPTVVNPGSVNMFSLLHDTTNFWDSPSAVLRDLGPAAKLSVFMVTGRDEYGNELPGPRIIDAFSKVIKDLPQWRAYQRGGKAAGQKPLPPLDKSDRDQMVARRRKALEQVVLGPGWMNGFGTLVSGGLTPREVNTDAIFARFWKELPMEERHKIEMEFIQDALQVQADFMKQPVPTEVGKAVTVLGRIERERKQRQHDTLKDKLSPREEIDVVVDSLEEQGLIGKDDAAKARVAASKIKIEDEYTDLKAALLNEYGNRKELEKWDNDVRQLWGFRKGNLQRKLELAGFKEKLTLSQGELFDVGRKYGEYVNEVERRKKLIDLETDSHEKDFLEADLEAWMTQQKPVKGIDFHRVAWADQKEHERQEHLRSAATGDWQKASSFDKELLGKKPADPEAWATYHQAIAAYYRDKAFDDPDLKADQRLGLAKSVNKLFPGFIRDWDFAAKRRFARLRELKPVRDSKNKSDWLWLLGQAEAFSQAIDSGSVTEKDAKEQWKDAVPQLREWIADNSPSFDQELLVYERQRKTFLQGLLERGRP